VAKVAVVFCTESLDFEEVEGDLDVLSALVDGTAVDVLDLSVWEGE
jgi:hypothetical protein